MINLVTFKTFSALHTEVVTYFKKEEAGRGLFWKDGILTINYFVLEKNIPRVRCKVLPILTLIELRLLVASNFKTVPTGLSSRHSSQLYLVASNHISWSCAAQTFC